jgi:hypothetical protein
MLNAGLKSNLFYATELIRRGRAVHGSAGGARSYSPLIHAKPGRMAGKQRAAVDFVDRSGSAMPCLYPRFMHSAGMINRLVTPLRECYSRAPLQPWRGFGGLSAGEQGVMRGAIGRASGGS